MTNCAKCGAELIGSRKFCAACGAPTDPSSLKRDASLAGPPSSPAPQPVPAQPQPTPTPQINVPSTAYGPPGPPVNPFAATASPASRAVGSPYGPPPATSANPSSPPPQGQPASVVSPLAVSNALSQRGAFQQAAGDRLPSSAPGAPASTRRGTGTSPPPPMAQKAPGTQLMPSIPNPSVNPSGRGSSPPAAPAKPAPQRTQLMDASSFVRPAAQPPSAPKQPIATPAQPVAPVPPAAPPPHAPGQWGWSAPAPVAPPHGYGFGYAPGARVNVTWSNGQRYPATVSQISGTQCLVVFPDGQQHWVEMQYLSPA